MKPNCSRLHSLPQEKEELCGSWSSVQPMLAARINFAAASGPDKDASGTVQGVDNDPRVYAIGGVDESGNYLSASEKYNPNNDTWTPIAALPIPLGDCTGSFVPDYGVNDAVTLGYIYVAGGGTNQIFRYNIKEDQWDVFPLPFTAKNTSLQYLDDFGGPLAEFFVALTGVDLPACTDGQTLWAIGGDKTEQQTWFIEVNTKGELVGNWARGPDLPLKRIKPLVGRVFWRDAGITTFGVSNCASVVVCGGFDETGNPTRDVQLLVRENCNWKWITKENNSTNIPDDTLTLAIPSANGSFGTEQWPETLITGGRSLLFGGIPPIDNAGATQFAQFRFIDERLQRDPCLEPDVNSPDSAWNQTTSMPGFRVSFNALPLSQKNSSIFGGRRVSRFLCIGGSDGQNVLKRAQLFQLPVPSLFTILTRNNICQKKHLCQKKDDEYWGKKFKL